jgi:histidyl-tRNA synthetase
MGLGIERALIVLEELGRMPDVGKPPIVFAVCLTSDKSAFTKIVAGLRTDGISVVTDPEARSAKSQFRQADKAGAKFALVIGDDELAAKSATVKNLAASEEASVPLASLSDHLRNSSAS